MDEAAVEEKKRKASLASGVSETRKRPASAPPEPDAKRPRLEPDISSTSTTFLATFNFTQLPSSLITDLIVANLEAFSENDLISLVNTYRQSRGITASPSSTSTPTPPVSQPVTKPIPTGPRNATPEVRVPAAPPPAVVKDEPVDPLQMDMDQDELEYEPDRLNEEVCTILESL